MRSFQKGIFVALCGLGLIHGTVAVSTATPTAAWTYKPVATGYTCPSIIVGTEDTCDNLPVKCGISAASFTSLNPKISCSSLAKGKPVCCALGEPDYPPKSGTGWCYTHTVRSGDTCAKMAAGYKVTTANIETWNKDTTAWYGCNDLQDGGQVCISKGQPPMPVAIGDAVCGPQVPGTGRPRMPFMIPTLNPCPAGQCCSRKGQCGTGADFCGSAALAVPAGSAMDASVPTNEVASESSKKDASEAATKGASEAAKKDASKAKSVSASDATSAKTTSATPKATSVGTIASLVARSLSTSTKNKDPHFFTTDIPLIDVPLTYLHPSTTKSPYPLVGTELASRSRNVIAHVMGIRRNSTTTTAISTTSISTPKVTSVTTSKETTKTKVKTTKTVNGIATVPSGWEMRMWDQPGCKGNYVVLQGHNAKLEDSDCMKFSSKSELKTDVNDESVSCRYMTLPEKGDWQWRDCHGINLNKPKSWKMSNGLCTVSPNTECDLWNDVSQTYGWRGPVMGQIDHTSHSPALDDAPPPYTDDPEPILDFAQPDPVQPPTSIQPLRLIGSAYVLPGGKDVKPTDKVSLTLEPALSSNCDELYNVIHQQINLPPRPLLYIHGTHTESSDGRKKDKNNNTVTDFKFKLDLAETMLTGWEGGYVSQDWKDWKDTEILTDEDLKPAYRGGIFRSRTYKPPKSCAAIGRGGDTDALLYRDNADELDNNSPDAGNLKMWCERFCHDPASVKSFTLHRQVAGFDYNAMNNVLSSHIRELNYRGSINFSVFTAHRSVTIYSPHWINRLRANRCVWWVVVLLQLWIITWPVIFFMEKRYEVVHTRWHASLKPEPDSLLVNCYPFGRNESSLAEYWAPAVKQAAWTRRHGEGDVLTRMDADRLQGYRTPVSLLSLHASSSETELERRRRVNSGQAGLVDNVVGLVRGIGEVWEDWRLSDGWGANT
ncbi:Peptidoglycan-binding Lysin subgroup [Penicillium robsamsonii]|uniref:Peptidoglycan-binding Lysin subgroup n=1 Tax=Penicillium robsamsonii TaxID=1792511 RepID=UPI002546F089|nr:Peptidoglycan-binding Lysin subgroup [Penicillium robsamsonii]KAJ5816258.1 Peptidoglycan-binding Lysin subgroup [Penicillium robsamsonii]